MADHPLVFDRTLLARRKVRIAPEFGNHDFLLRHVGEDFCDRLSLILRDFSIVVNLGACNGTLVDPLRKLSRSGNDIGPVIHIDPCASLLRQTDGLRVVADEEFLPLRDASVDLVLAGPSLQFINDLPGVLIQICRCLKPDGLMLAALPGGRTLFELRDAFGVGEAETTGGVSPRIGPFADIRDCGGLMQRAGFALPVSDSYEVQVTYPNVLALLQELRFMGAGNVLLERLKRPMRRETLFRAMAVYAEKYSLPDGRIPATFEFITLTGWAPHSGQQKPLRPGSAKMRLADALRVSDSRFRDNEDNCP